LVVGGIGSLAEAEIGEEVILLGWGGLFFSFLTIVSGAVSLGKPRKGGKATILFSIAGAILGGDFVAVCMALALVGGIISVRTVAESDSEGGGVASTKGRSWAAPVAGAVGLLILVALFAPDKKEQSGKVFEQERERVPELAPEPAPAPAEIQSSGGIHSAAGQLLLKVGETARSGMFEVRLNSFKTTKQIYTELSVENAEPGNVYALLNVTVRCVDKESRFYMSGSLHIEDNGRELLFDNEELMLGLDSPAGQLNPYTEKSGYVVFLIPERLSGAKMIWQPGRGFDDAYFVLARR
jgi:hypothetical protein